VDSSKSSPTPAPPDGSPSGGARPQVRSGLAHRRNPVLATAGDIAIGVRRLVFRDKLALFLGIATAALAIAFFVLLGSIGPSSRGAQLPISRVIALAEHRQIGTATLLDHDNRVEITLKAPATGTAGTEGKASAATGGAAVTATTPSPAAAPEASLEYWAAYPASGAQTQQLLQSLTHSGATVTVDQQSGKMPRTILVQFLLPILSAPTAAPGVSPRSRSSPGKGARRARAKPKRSRSQTSRARARRWPSCGRFATT
jgi:hypothetical protein